MSSIKTVISDLFYKVHAEKLCEADGPNTCKTHDLIAHILGYQDEADMMTNCKDSDGERLKPFFGEHFNTLYKAARAKHGG